MANAETRQTNDAPAPAQLLQWICELVPAWAPEDIGSFRYLEGGYSNRNYRFAHEGAQYVLRVPFRQRPFVDRYQEQALLRTARLPDAPEIIAFDADSGRMISRWVSGRLLADLNPEPQQVLAYLRGLHAAMPEAPRVYDPLLQAKAYLADAGAPAWIRRLADDLNWPLADTVSCHNDLNPWNVIREPSGRWVTLDWEWFGRNDPLFDLVTLHQSLALGEVLLHELAEALLGAPVEASRLRACLTAFWLREYAWAAAELAAGDSRDEIAGQRWLGEQRLRDLR